MSSIARRVEQVEEQAAARGNAGEPELVILVEDDEGRWTDRHGVLVDRERYERGNYQIVLFRRDPRGPQ